MPTITRRVFLGWSGFVGVGVLAHHKPGHGPPPTTTTTTTTTLPPGGGGLWSTNWRTTW